MQTVKTSIGYIVPTGHQGRDSPALTGTPRNNNSNKIIKTRAVND